MRSVLGIDAAWTRGQPSGVALISETEATGWKCLAVAPSYTAFVDLAQGHTIDWESERFRGSLPDADEILKASTAITGKNPDVIAIDMPVSSVEFTSRRTADNSVSAAFGKYQAAAHSPSSQRPGRLGSQLSVSLAARGYPVANSSTKIGSTPMLVEVYPHPSLIRLMNVEKRLPYKHGKSTKYWPGADILSRKSNLLSIYASILMELSRFVADIDLNLPSVNDVPSLAHLKRYEDAIDALVCGWTGIEYLENRAEPFGDDYAAIWVPREQATQS